LVDDDLGMMNADELEELDPFALLHRALTALPNPPVEVEPDEPFCVSEAPDPYGLT
jgi:hypothetical protein